MLSIPTHKNVLHKGSILLFRLHNTEHSVKKSCILNDRTTQYNRFALSVSIFETPAAFLIAEVDSRLM